MAKQGHVPRTFYNDFLQTLHANYTRERSSDKDSMFYNKKRQTDALFCDKEDNMFRYKPKLKHQRSS